MTASGRSDGSPLVLAVGLGAVLGLLPGLGAVSLDFPCYPGDAATVVVLVGIMDVVVVVATD